MRILYCTDGSEGSLAGARLLAGLPLEADTVVTILTVLAAGDHSDGAEAIARAANALRCCTAGIARLVRTGHPADQILRAAQEEEADLIVVGSRGRSALARFILGSVAERVARHAPCSVLLARPARAELREVILGVDGSEGALRAAEWLASFPLPAECEIRLLTTLPNLREIARQHLLMAAPLADSGTSLDEWQRDGARQLLQGAVAALEAAGKTAVTETRSGDPAEVLLDTAQEEDAGMIVVGSHGHGVLDRFLLGSVSESVLRHAHCSVLVVTRARARVLQPKPGTAIAAQPPLARCPAE